mgnify:CR=1 FL=1
MSVNDDLPWVAPLCSPETAKDADGKSLEAFLGGQELLHLKLDGQPRDLLWGDYLRRNAIAIPVSGGLAFDTAVTSAKYAMTSGGVMLGDVDRQQCSAERSGEIDPDRAQVGADQRRAEPAGRVERAASQRAEDHHREAQRGADRPRRGAVCGHYGAEAVRSLHMGRRPATLTPFP